MTGLQHEGFLILDKRTNEVAHDKIFADESEAEEYLRRIIGDPMHHEIRRCMINII
jgi:hypothetical protein